MLRSALLWALIASAFMTANFWAQPHRFPLDEMLVRTAIFAVFGALIGAVLGFIIAGVRRLIKGKPKEPTGSLGRSMAFGVTIYVVIIAFTIYSNPPKFDQQSDLTAEEISKIKTAADELSTFAESLPDCSKGFPTGARKEIWDAYIQYCEPGVTVPKGR